MKEMKHMEDIDESEVNKQERELKSHFFLALLVLFPLLFLPVTL